MRSAVSWEWTWHRNWVRYRLTCTTWDKHSALHSVLSSPGRITKGAYLHKQGIGLCLLLIPHSTCPLQRIAAKYRQWGADQSSYSYLSLTGSSACWTTKPGGQHALLQACKSCNNIHEMGRELRTWNPCCFSCQVCESLVLDRLDCLTFSFCDDKILFSSLRILCMDAVATVSPFWLLKSMEVHMQKPGTAAISTTLHRINPKCTKDLTQNYYKERSLKAT